MLSRMGTGNELRSNASWVGVYRHAHLEQCRAHLKPMAKARGRRRTRHDGPLSALEALILRRFLKFSGRIKE